MTRLRTTALPLALLVSLLALSGCATKPKEKAVAEPAPALAATVETTAVAEPVAAPAVEAKESAPAPSVAAQETATAPVVKTEQIAPKPAVKKARKKHPVKVEAPKAAEPEPVAAPAPVPAPQAAPVPVPVEPTPAPVTVQPIEPIATPGFLETYWMWLLGIVLAVVGYVVLTRKKE